MVAEKSDKIITDAYNKLLESYLEPNPLSLSMHMEDSNSHYEIFHAFFAV